ncbi:TetR/AcrR family transcriptional regulator [Bradyrhizobium sp. WBOS7]|uniref:TetR/AcrR family transcriptional regulator n=1 Tax=Bradyrhizobium betae TaxID=244734 RepID=A0AAE9N817_9BRAD|nr:MULTISPECIES: TetR/AcrR family transcriptional regulator [Bradyrhizobium]MDD1572530.1 TetR/AcrR family transcriptional regulator [Bradyrhizobium sp. WBOS1]UUO34084.1 TetR/AcrR family transcriptional regulator [Bradyrhizobium sp. WBOS01]MDD1528397.1 TetR/AcrR family transcriptional regulator [Bradyrhizobium sp. WBOS2]MDD1577281.1 TetR/AcrR family transcriptional regulator [Bradyrhizobium sp. WBOS7]MDD1600328.1 TetR/AcrR family transcriptional regulator [Bradyrhizobium sp. WBOS16]
MQAKAPPQDRILDAALRVFRRHGFRRSSIEQAAEEAGLTRQALYHHFASKEALFRAVLERIYAQGLAAEIAAAKAAEDAGLDLADILVAEIGARMQSLLASLKDSPHTEELFSEHLAQARDLYQSYSSRFTEEIATTIARVCRKRKLKLESGVSVRELARCVEMAIHGTKSAFPSMQPVDAFLKQLETMLRMLIAGAMAPSAKKSHRKTGVRT